MDTSSMVWHHWKNNGNELARLLCLFLPGGAEESFVEWGHPVTDATAPPLAVTPQDIQHAVLLPQALWQGLTSLTRNQKL